MLASRKANSRQNLAAAETPQRAPSLKLKRIIRYNRYFPFLAVLVLTFCFEWWDYNTLPQDNLKGKTKHNEGTSIVFPKVVFVMNVFSLAFLNFQDLQLDDSAEDFNVHNARQYLEKLTSLGTRVTGSKANEIIASHWIKNQIEILINQRDATKDKNVLIEYDIQHPTSSFFLDFLGGITNVMKRY
jgi:hypothetical protein